MLPSPWGSRRPPGVVAFVLAAAAAAVLLSASGAPVVQNGALFGPDPAPGIQAAVSVARPEVLRSRYAMVNLDRLDQPQLLLNLFDDVVVTAVRDSIEPTANGIVWVGHVDGLADSTVTLVKHGNVVAGSFAYLGGTFSIRSAPVSGTDEMGTAVRHEISQVDQS